MQSAYMSQTDLNMSANIAVVPMDMAFPEVDFTERMVYQTALEIEADVGTGNVSVVPVASSDKWVLMQLVAHDCSPCNLKAIRHCLVLQVSVYLELKIILHWG
jgi:hypothetical protein